MADTEGIRPDWKLLDADGRDWSWAYVIFRGVLGWPGYLAGSDGWVWSRRRLGRNGGVGDQWRRLSQSHDSNGYKQVRLSVQGYTKLFMVHHFVLEAFFGPRPPGMIGRHMNDKPADNRASNLAWGTYEQNTQDSIRNGTCAIGKARRATAKLKESDIPVIRALLAQGLRQAEIATRFGVCRENISQISLGKKWKGVV